MKKAPGLIALLLVLAFGQSVHAGFGVSPAKVLERNLIRGSVVERVIYIVQGTPEKDLHVTATIAEGEVKDWIKISPGADFVIPKGTQQFPLTIQVTVPKDASLGVYKGSIRVGTVPEKPKVEEGGSGVSISVGARIDVDLTVGEGVHYEFAIRNIDIKNISEVEFPRAEIRIENLGNVPAGPEEAAFELYNKFGDIRLAYVQGIKLNKVEPFTTMSLDPEFPLPVRLLPGEYWGTVRIYDSETKLIREFKKPFNVDKATFFQKYRNTILAGVGVILFGLVLFIVGKRTGKRRR